MGILRDIAKYIKKLALGEEDFKQGQPAFDTFLLSQDDDGFTLSHNVKNDTAYSYVYYIPSSCDTKITVNK